MTVAIDDRGQRLFGDERQCGCRSRHQRHQVEVDRQLGCVVGLDDWQPDRIGQCRDHGGADAGADLAEVVGGGRSGAHDGHRELVLDDQHQDLHSHAEADADDGEVAAHQRGGAVGAPTPNSCPAPRWCG